MNKRQIKDVELCDEMAERGETKNCFNCSCSVCLAQLPDEDKDEIQSLRTRNAELESENGRLRDLLNESRKGLINLCEYNIIPERYREEALFRANEIYKALSQKAGDRYVKMQAVVEAAKEAYDFLEIRALAPDVTDKLEQALAELEGGGASEILHSER